MQFSKFSPTSRWGPTRASNRRNSGTNGQCVFYQDKSGNFVTFKLKGVAGGAVGSLWQVLLYRSGSNRFSFRLVNPAGDILVTITKVGMTVLRDAVNVNVKVKDYVTMSVDGTIDGTTEFAGSLTDYCRFRGGS